MTSPKRARKKGRAKRASPPPGDGADETRAAGAAPGSVGDTDSTRRAPESSSPAAASPEEAERHAVGDRIGGRYEVLAVHTGSTGVVYAAFDHQAAVPRALKTLRRRFEAEAAMRDLFVEEAALWVRLEKHPFIARAYGVEEIEHRPYVVIEYVQGREGLPGHRCCGLLEAFCRQICRRSRFLRAQALYVLA